MAPVSNSVVGIDDDQRFALMKFRRSVRDVLKPEYDDHFLLRWLRARQWDAEAAEKMLRDSLEWRLKWEVDTNLKTWQPPEVLQKYFPSGSTGFDKEGSPIIIVPIAGLDMWGLLHSVNRTDLLKRIIVELEKYLTLSKKQAQTHGSGALKLTVLFDLDGFNLRQYAWKPAAEMVFSLLQIYEANYPEILKICFIINSPKVFSVAFSIIKKFMHEYTISKIKILGSEKKKWQEQVFNVIDRNQMPAHYGGTMVDDNGDPKCSLIIKPGGKIPKSYYTKNLVDSDKEYTRITIKTGQKHSVDLLCAEEESVLKWDIGVDNHDIKFVIKRRGEDNVETVVHGPRKIPQGPADIGILSVTGPATYTVTFDNSSAYLRSKKVYYDILITEPIKNLKLQDIPDNEDHVASCTN